MATIFPFEVLAWASTLFMGSNLMSWLYDILHGKQLTVGRYILWDSWNEEEGVRNARKSDNLNIFCPFLFLQFFKIREHFFGTLPLLPQLVVLLGQLLKEAKVGLHLPGGVQNDSVIIRLSLLLWLCDYVHLPVMWYVCDEISLAYNLEVKMTSSKVSPIPWQPPTTCCSSCTGAPGWRSSPSWSSSRRPRSSRNGCFPCSS